MPHLHFLVYSYVCDVSRVFLITSRLMLLNNTEFNIVVDVRRGNLRW